MKIAQQGRRWAVPHFAMKIEGTCGLIAVTKENCFSNWTLTHVPSGCAFSVGYLRSKKHAIEVGIRIFELLGDQLKTKSPKKATSGWTKQEFVKAIKQ